MAGLLQCVVTRRADEPIHPSGERERENRRARKKAREENEEQGSERWREIEGERKRERKANGAPPTRFLCGPQLCCFLGLRNETLPANNPTWVLILRRRAYVPAPP